MIDAPMFLLGMIEQRRQILPTGGICLNEAEIGMLHRRTIHIATDDLRSKVK
jgi:hypothetical protein